MEFTRYALFYTPAPGPLATFGAGWLGWDPATGTAPPPPDIPDLPPDRDALTERPRKYGFHGTLKPPFALADSHDAHALRPALRDFCAGRAPVTLAGVELAQLGRFLALVPTGDTTALDALAADTVRSFDRFRAPMSADEIARRRTRHLSPRQEELLQRWGYPYVMEAFRFHLTLTGKLPKAQATALYHDLTPRLSPLLPQPLVIDAISLLGEGPDGNFHLIERCPLSGENPHTGLAAGKAGA